MIHVLLLLLKAAPFLTYYVPPVPAGPAGAIGPCRDRVNFGRECGRSSASSLGQPLAMISESPPLGLLGMHR